LFGNKGNRRVRLSSGRLPIPDLQQPVRAWARAALCLGLAAVLVAGGIGLRHLLLHGRHFALAEIRVSPLRHVDRDRLIQRSGLALGRSLFIVDLTEAERRIAREPWVASVRVRRELPHTLSIEVTEREARAAVSLGASYLVDERGELFKRARADEVEGLPLITGLARERYLSDSARSRSVLLRAIELDRRWRQEGQRAAPTELRHDGGNDSAATFTVQFPHAGRSVGVRIGSADDSTQARLRRLDAVLAALDADGQQPSLIHLDQRVQLDRIAVQLVGSAEQNTHKQNGAVGSTTPGTQAL